MPDLKDISREVLKDSYLFSLGTIDTEGPWQAYLFFISAEDMNIYWLSNPATRHSKALEANAQTSAVFLASHEKDNEKGIQMSGTARRIDPPSAAIQTAYSQKRTPEGQYDFASVLNKGYSWYQFTPSYIGLTYTKHFGFKRQQVL